MSSHLFLLILFLEMANSAHPSIWVLIGMMQKEVDKTSHEATQSQAGQSNVRPNKIFARLNQRIRTLHSRYQQGHGGVEALIEGMIHNVEFDI